MKKLLLPLLLCSGAAFAQEDPNTQFFITVKQSQTYEFGQSRKGLIELEHFVLSAVGDKQKSVYAEDTLLRAMAEDNVTPDARRFFIRLLDMVGEHASINLLKDYVPQPEFSGQALQALEAIASRLPVEVDAALTPLAVNPPAEVQAAVLAAMGRYKSAAVGGLAATLLTSESPLVRNAIASAVASVPSPEGCAAIAANLVSGGDRAPLYDGCLGCLATVAAGDPAAALDWFKALLAPETDAHVRAQAFLQLAKMPALADAAQEAARQELLKAADADQDIELARARVKLLEENPEGAASIVALLENPDPKVQVLALGALARRGDASAVGAIAAKAAAEDPDVRAAAMKALIASNSDEAIEPLFAMATGENAEAKRAAVDALSRINAPGANAKLAAVVQSGQPAQQAAALDLLAARRAADTHDVVAAAAASTDPAVFASAQAALSVLAVEADLPTLLDQGLNLADAARATEFQNTAVALAERLPEEQQTALLGERLAAATDPAVRAAILGIMGRLGGKPALDAVAAASKDADPAVRLAAAKALGQWKSAEVLPALAAMVKTDAPDEASAAAFDGIASVMREVKLPSDEGLKYVQVLRRAAKSDSDGRRLLQAIARVTDLRAFRIADSLSRQEPLQIEAEQTLVALGKRLAGAYPRVVQGRMVQIARSTKNEKLKAEAQQVANAVNSFGTYVTSWAVSGPYKQEGKLAPEIYDVHFAPEDALECGDPLPSGHLGWEILPAGVTPEMPGYVDLQEEFFDNECVVFARTCLEMADSANAHLKIGSDDGFKVWLDGKLLASKLGMRHYVPDEDEVLLDLNKGKHTIVIAVYNQASNWGFSVNLNSLTDTPLVNLKMLPPK